jgi:hypothetical protein
MIGRGFVMLAVPLAIIAVPAWAQRSQQDQSQANERRICRMMDRPGSLAGSRRVCLTRAEWELAATEQQRVGQQIVRNSDGCAMRAEGGTPVGNGPGDMQASMQRTMGC